MSHADSIARWATEVVTEKYERGQRAHGGTINNKNVLPCLVEEVLDSVVYLAVLCEQHEVIRQLAEQGIMYDGGHHKDEYLQAILNIINTGNERGIQEEEAEEPLTKTFDAYYKKQIAERILNWLTE